MALQKEIWINEIQETLFPQNTLIGQVGVNDDAFVNYKTVHLPQSGANPSVVQNRSSYPATPAQRTDTEITYNLNEYTSDPTHITKVDELQISYPKRQSVLSQHVGQLQTVITNQTLYSWATSGVAGRQVRTSGANSTLALAPSATGTRKALTLDDIAAAAAILDNDNFEPNEDRYLIMPASVYWQQFVTISQVNKYLEYGAANTPTGKVAQILGFKILVRSSVVVYDNVATPALKAISGAGVPSAPAATDNLGIFAVTNSAVRKAMGSIDVFASEDRPEWYGSIFSAIVMHGASKARTNSEGIVNIIQAA